jgi:predicted AlkP superfamily phosphohydrolase/phosphomutase
VNGIIIPGFDTPDTSSQSTHPEGILDEIEKKWVPTDVIDWAGMTKSSRRKGLMP